MLPHSSGRAGAWPIGTLTVLLLVTLSIMMLRPAGAESVTLQDGLGPDVETAPLTI